jgi:hypothetical protein
MRKGSVVVFKLPLERLVIQCLFVLALIPISVVGFYLVMTKSPLHLVFDALEPAGPGSVYVRGKFLSLSKLLHNRLLRQIQNGLTSSRQQ